MMKLHRSEYEPRGVYLEPFRMIMWAAIAAALYFITFDTWIGLQDWNPGLQTTVYNAANVTLRAYLGYWITRALLGRLRLDGSDPPLALVARAILVGAVVLTSK